MKLRRAVLAFPLLMLADCGEKEIRAIDYETTCTVDEDCIVVSEGRCSDCGHPRSPAAINASDAKAYQRAFEDLSCGGDSDIICDSADFSYAATCESQVCVARRECSSFSPLACASQAHCAVVRGARLDDTTSCVVEQAELSCRSLSFGCTDSVTGARDPDGHCWVFSNGCTAGLPEWQAVPHGECTQIGTDCE